MEVWDWKRTFVCDFQYWALLSRLLWWLAASRVHCTPCKRPIQYFTQLRLILSPGTPSGAELKEIISFHGLSIWEQANLGPFDTGAPLFAISLVVPPESGFHRNAINPAGGAGVEFPNGGHTCVTQTSSRPLFCVRTSPVTPCLPTYPKQHSNDTYRSSAIISVKITWSNAVLILESSSCCSDILKLVRCLRY